MSYRGDDLDLRTPQTSRMDLAVPPTFASAARARSGAATGVGPIWVDQAALDCCNHAFDVAAAHRAQEVRLEHLIYALTRIDEAAEAIEARGIDPETLRREAATEIASDLPAHHGNGKMLPRRSDALEEVLRLAATGAYRRQAPAGVADIVRVLFDSGVEFAGLRRTAIGFSHIQNAESAYDEDVLREHVRRAAAAPQDHERSFELGTAVHSREPRHPPSRLDILEQSIRTLTAELANERKIISGVLQDLQQELMAQRDDTNRLSGITQDKIQAVFGDRLHSLEQAFLSSRNAPEGEIHDRLTVIERTLTAEIVQTRTAIEALAARPGPDLAPLAQRIEVIEDAVLARDTDQRLAALESAIDAERERAKAADEALLDAIARIPTVDVDSLRSAMGEELAEARQRIEALETALAEHANRSETAASQTAEDLTAMRDTLSLEFVNTQESVAKLAESVQSELSELHVDLGKVNGNQHTIASAIDTQTQDSANAFSVLTTRIESLEKASAKPVEMLEALSGTIDKMHRVTVERYYRRNRFWYWLFGTDDWLAASWPSQSARIAEELRSIRRQ